MIGYRRGYQLQQLADLTLPSVATNEKVPMTPGIGDGQTAVFGFADQEVRLCNSSGQTEDGYGMKPTQLKYGTDYQVMINGKLVDRERLMVNTIKGSVTFKNIPFTKSGTSKQQPPKSVSKTIPFDPISKLKPEAPVYQDQSTILNDPTANFKRSGVKPGMHISNLTTGVTGEIIAPASGDSELATWTRAATVISVTQPFHGYVVDESLTIVQSSDLLAVPLGTVKVTSVNPDGYGYTFTCQDAGGAEGTLSVGIPSNNVGGTVLYSSNPGLLWQDKDSYQIVSDEHSPAQVIEGEITETFPYLYDNTVDFLSEDSQIEADGFVWVQRVRVGDTLVKNPGPNQVEGTITNVSNHTLEAEGLQWQPGVDTYKVYRVDSVNTSSWPNYVKAYERCPLRDSNDPDYVLRLYTTSVLRNCAHWYDPGNNGSNLFHKEIWISTDYDFLSDTWGRNSLWSGQIHWYRHTAECAPGSSVGRVHPGMIVKIVANGNQAVVTGVSSNQLNLSNNVTAFYGSPFLVSAKVNLGIKGQAGLIGTAKDPTPGVESATESVQLFNGKVNFNNLEWSPGVFAPVTPGMYIENLTNPQDGLIDFVGPYLEATNSTTAATKVVS